MTALDPACPESAAEATSPKWTSERVAFITEQYLIYRKSGGEIARMLGPAFTRNSVTGKLFRTGALKARSGMGLRGDHGLPRGANFGNPRSGSRKKREDAKPPAPAKSMEAFPQPEPGGAYIVKMTEALFEIDGIALLEAKAGHCRWPARSAEGVGGPLRPASLPTGNALTGGHPAGLNVAHPGANNPMATRNTAVAPALSSKARGAPGINQQGAIHGPNRNGVANLNTGPSDKRKTLGSAPMYRNGASPHPNGGPMTMNGRPFNPNWGPMRMQGAPMQANGGPIYPNRTPFRANAAPFHANGAPFHPNAAPFRANGAPMHMSGMPPRGPGVMGGGPVPHGQPHPNMPRPAAYAQPHPAGQPRKNQPHG